jgi:molybdate transport system substrate-binding protein
VISNGALVSCAVAIGAACAGGSGSGGESNSGRTTVAVAAAASLTDAFADMATAFEALNPDLAIEFSFGSSTELVSQLEQGAPFDVIATADAATMTRAVDAGVVAQNPSSFATNSLAIMVSPDNPFDISSVTDLADPKPADSDSDSDSDSDIVVVICAETVPCGSYTALMLDRANLTITPASYEQNVRGVVGKVLSGEADAGIVYVSDVVAADRDAYAVAIPDDINVVADYQIAPANNLDAEMSAAAARFVDFVRSPEGQDILLSYGFGSYSFGSYDGATP